MREPTSSFLSRIFSFFSVSMSSRSSSSLEALAMDAGTLAVAIWPPPLLPLRTGPASGTAHRSGFESSQQ